MTISINELELALKKYMDRLQLIRLYREFFEFYSITSFPNQFLALWIV